MRRTLLVALSLAFPLTGQEAPPKKQAPPPPWQRLGLDRAIAWTLDPEDFVDSARPKRELAQQVDRGALIDAAIARAKTDGSVVLWYVHRIVEQSSRGRQMYRAPVLDLYMHQVVFDDPDVAAIVGKHFVPLRMVCDEAMAARFALRPLDFIEPAVVFVGADGKVLHVLERIRTFDALWFARLLGRVLEQAGVKVPAEQAEGAGQYEKALVALGAGKEPATEYRRAKLLRRLGQHDEALEALARASGAAAKGELATERGLVLLLAGRTADARAALADAAGEESPRRSEATYLLGAALRRAGDHDGARRAFTELVAHDPDSTFGARARANIERGEDQQPFGATFSGFESFAYLDPGSYRGLPRDTRWAGDAQDTKALAGHAVRFLLTQQRQDGGFTDSRYAYWPSPKITPNVWVAITALAACALDAHRAVDPEGIDAAVRRAEAWMFDPAHLSRGQNEDVYADAYRLLYLTQRHARSPDADLVARMNALIAEATKRQDEHGFFAHEYANAFCTAALLWSLHRARACGAEVPLETLSKGVTALQSARSAEGGFVYGGQAGKRPVSLKDASARMPLCESALFAFGASDKEKVATAFATFWAYIDRIEKLRRNDFHSDGELAGFFFFHALFHAAECAELLSDEARKATDERLGALLQRIPELDGSFIDSHELGRSYGTAMALLVLARLDARAGR